MKSDYPVQALSDYAEIQFTNNSENYYEFSKKFFFSISNDVTYHRFISNVLIDFSEPIKIFSNFLYVKFFFIFKNLCVFKKILNTLRNFSGDSANSFTVIALIFFKSFFNNVRKFWKNSNVFRKTQFAQWGSKIIRFIQ